MRHIITTVILLGLICTLHLLVINRETTSTLFKIIDLAFAVGLAYWFVRRVSGSNQ